MIRCLLLLTGLLALMVAVPASAAAEAVSQGARAVPATDPRAASAAVDGLLDAFGQGIADLQRAASRPEEAPAPTLDEDEAIEIARSSDRLSDWLDGHPVSRTHAEIQKDDTWKVSYVSRAAGRPEKVEAEVYVSDESGEITEVRTGPQVAWFMARGHDGAFGRAVNEPAIWTALSLAFLAPLLRFRRLVSLRTLDLVALLSLTVSWAWFNQGEIFTSVPLQYPPLVYLALRLAWIGHRRARHLRERSVEETGPTEPATGRETALARPAGPRPGLANWCPTWLLVTILLFALALRYGLNAFDSNVIDVGYAGVIGADLIAHGETPYGNFPSDCGRCDTYGPLNYVLYVPFEAAIGFSGRWDSLPAAHGAATFFDLLAIGGMLMLGLRLGGWRLGVVLALAWSTLPWTAFALESNSNDALVGALLAWGLALATRPFARGLTVALAATAKFTPAVLLPLWWRHPFPRAPRDGRRRRAMAVLGGVAVAVGATGWVLFLDGLDGVTAFWSRTLGYQAGRDSPFSIWGQYPGLRPLQIGVAAVVLAAAVALLRWPRRLDMLSMAAFSGALLTGAELVLEHWFYLYVPWFVPFALVAMVPDWPETAAERREPVRERLAHPVPVPT